nr:PREDICTED: flowering time control protein FPA isoform X1 [Musa acuminata subsp. malaccensis]XP_018684803.1 PREDICTED: flowering time control protein FPA isoform X1 [Musa acuminata subsp. malaccensis]XP_018684804.1 PREDICTED: flowering time control protein FPA isoform X1 [Musa acuminata subsp. malaccensis]
MMGRGGRDRLNNEHTSRLEEKERRTGWGVAPPSRHLWVGNLSSHVTQNTLYEHFLRFGDIENIAYMPGRSYAFVNYKKEEDAVIALRGLQGSIVAGNSLRVEFAKGKIQLQDRASVSSQDDGYSQLEERYSIERGEPLFRRDVRAHRQSPEKSHDKNKGSRSTEPSEVLWIGFPVYLNVEEEALRRAFSPFGEIENIATFPGRSYAFVRYRSIVAACRAKEALQGKLFNNPRVHICFARSEFSTESGRNSSSAPILPHLKLNYQPGLSGQSPEPSHWGRGFDSHIGEFPIASPQDASFIRPGDASFTGFEGNSSIRPGAGPGSIFTGDIEHNRLQELGSERRMSEELYERYRNSPAAERHGRWHDVPFERSQRTPPLDDSWGVEDHTFPLTKKPKIDTFSDKELPEYPFSDMEQGKRDFGLPKFSPNLPYGTAYNKSFESVPFDHKGVPQHLRTINGPLADSDESWRMLDSSSAGPGPLPLNAAKLQRPSPELHQPPRILEWKWEGTIAKGGTTVCRARCFPVGKVLDFMLPEFLNCTARTGLDMLAKHYYQAAGTWVVFFVPETDADIVFYNEFMHYLGEKQRAAVAKLGEKVTLFLVPPSDFSEQVLKVPGKVSISGVILKFQQPGSNFGSLHHPLEAGEPKLPPLVHQPIDVVRRHEDTSFAKPKSPDLRAFSQGQNYFSASSGLLPPPPPTFPPPQKRGDNFPYSGSMHPMEKLPDYHIESRQDQPQPPSPAISSKWSNQMHIPTSDHGDFPSTMPSAVSHLSSNSDAESYLLGNHKVAQGSASSNYAPESSGIPTLNSKYPTQEGTKPQVSSNLPLSLQPEQLAQLAVLLGQQKQAGKEPALSADGQTKLANLLQISSSHAQSPVMSVQATDPHAQTSTTHAYSSLPPNLLGAQLNQVPQYQQHPSNVPAVQPVVNPGQQNNQQAPNNSREDAEADPQKRLQATLQLAAALLQQIQQQSKTADQH